MERTQKIELINYLITFISNDRKKRFDEVISQRTDHLRIVLEDVYQGHNASAILRSCDCFGIQNIHYIEKRNNIKISADVDMGSSKWLNIHKHRNGQNNTLDAINLLKEKGYRIVATTPHKNDCTIDKLPVDKKLALIFGTEIEGISDTVLEHADEFVKVPMYGFTESFNVSVCSALCLYELITRIRESVPNHLLSEDEKTDIYFNWLINSIDASAGLIENFYKKKSTQL